MILLKRSYQKEAQMIINRSSLKEKFDKTPAFVAHCSAEQLVDLAIKESGLTLV